MAYLLNLDFLRLQTERQKTYRPHVFCGVTKSDISRHMMSAHRHEQTIIDIALLNKSERIVALAQLRRDGNGQSNATILAGGGSSSDLVCERKSVGVGGSALHRYQLG